MSPVVLKQKLLAEIEQLPDYRLQEVLDFVRFLRWQTRQPSEENIHNHKPDEADDPMLRFIGGVAHGSLAQNIDAELYTL